MKKALVIGVINAILFVFLIGLFVSWGSNYDVSYENDPFWKTVGMLALLNILGYGLYRWWPKKIAQPVMPMVKSPDPRADLQRARDLFDTGAHKEAYALVSRVLREWIAYCFGTGELTSQEALHLLRKKGQATDIVEMAGKCLHECMLVAFARQNPEKKNFEKTANLAESVIKS
ncbi:MAG: hypothetical protein ACLFP2_05535 [Candidatus Woesearchaeota archaeon]